ncbi:MinD/ParA family protein [Thermohalobacter berrensis]|uniref:ATP-binding protein n=1 Tax=Thermohalobacter berrensis TaxID=99594 RepID=A0A419TAE5_9FIRM|nr:MinD/ParA family protein [Thermohalobacter berrensis]RKD34454.1 ATP-binding protein [Thermohalobacter berrensis]
MRDQAEKLREIMRDLKFSNNINNNRKRTKNTRVLAITSGKGGVGKTNFTVNLAISLSNLGYKVVIFDADIGLANIDVLFGIYPKYTLADIINGRKNILDIITDGPNGIKIIAGGSGITELMNVDRIMLDKLSNQLEKLESMADFILIDTGAGVANTVLNFVKAADEVILVTTPEPTSLTDAYAMIKVLTMMDEDNKIQLVINRVKNSKEANDIYEKIEKVSSRFLNVNVEYLGYLYNSKLLTDSVIKQNPLLLMYPNSPIAKKINGIALKILGDQKSYEDSSGIKKFVNVFKSFLDKGGN